MSEKPGAFSLSIEINNLRGDLRTLTDRLHVAHDPDVLRRTVDQLRLAVYQLADLEVDLAHARGNLHHCRECGCQPSHPCTMDKRWCDQEGERGLFGLFGTATLTPLGDGYACWWVEIDLCSGCAYPHARAKKG